MSWNPVKELKDEGPSLTATWEIQWNPVKELKARNAEEITWLAFWWNPVKELKVARDDRGVVCVALVESGEGIERHAQRGRQRAGKSWNPEKELKDDRGVGKVSKVSLSWNPEKELKVLVIQSWW